MPEVRWGATSPVPSEAYGIGMLRLGDQPPPRRSVRVVGVNRMSLNVTVQPLPVGD